LSGPSVSAAATSDLSRVKEGLRKVKRPGFDRDRAVRSHHA
jgi:hypothetical protein